MARRDGDRLRPEATAITEFACEEACGRWVIQGISHAPREKHKLVESGPLFEVGGLRWGLRAYWGGAEGKDVHGKDVGSVDGQYAVFARVFGVGSKRVSPTYMISLVNQDNKNNTIKINSNSSGEVFCESTPARGWPNFGKFDDLLSPAKGFCKDDTVIFELQIQLALREPRKRKYAATFGVADGETSSISGNSNCRSIADDAVALLASGRASDVELRGSEEQGEEGVRAHRLILAMRSPVFQKMLFESEMQESKANAKINIEGADSVIIKKFLGFLYSDKLDEETASSWELLCHLVTIAHRYEVQPLVDRFVAEISAKLSEESAAQALMVAERLGLTNLKECVKGYLRTPRSRLARAQKTESFVRMAKNCPHLLLELVADMVSPQD